MRAYPIGKRVGNVKNEGPELIARITGDAAHFVIGRPSGYAGSGLGRVRF